MYKSDDEMVTHPQHYKLSNGIEVLDVIKGSMTPEAFFGYCQGNVVKYVLRSTKKGGRQDLEKAAFYLNEMIDMYYDQLDMDENDEGYGELFDNWADETDEEDYVEDEEDQDMPEENSAVEPDQHEETIENYQHDALKDMLSLEKHMKENGATSEELAKVRGFLKWIFAHPKATEDELFDAYYDEFGIDELENKYDKEDERESVSDKEVEKFEKKEIMNDEN